MRRCVGIDTRAALARRRLTLPRYAASYNHSGAGCWEDRVLILTGGMLDWLANAGIVGAVVVWIGRWLSSRRSLDGEQQAWLRLIRHEMAENRRRLIELDSRMRNSHDVINIGGSEVPRMK
jgi:hypothetical protein